MATAKDVLKRAKELVDKGEVDKAKKYYEIIIERMPNSDEAKIARNCLDELNKPQEPNFDDLFEEDNNQKQSGQNTEAEQAVRSGLANDVPPENIIADDNPGGYPNSDSESDEKENDKKLKVSKKSVGNKKKNKGCLIAIVIVIILIIAAAASGGNKSGSKGSSFGKKKQVEMADFSNMAAADRDKWGKDNDITINVTQKYSDSVANDGFISQSVKAGKKVSEGSSVTVTYSKGPKPTVEQRNALAKAKNYSDVMHMSKQGIYDQLTSQYGEGFDAASAQYAIDHLKADYNKNALAKAKDYQSSMNMSKSAIYNQLVSSYGERFTPSEAQYAVNNLAE